MENDRGWVERQWDWYSVPDGAGVLAIRHAMTGKSYFIAVADMRQRAYDLQRLLNLGTHHNLELQRDWSADASKFKFEVVERVAHVPMLRVFKAVWVERHGDRTYNLKSSLPRPK